MLKEIFYYLNSRNMHAIIAREPAVLAFSMCPSFVFPWGSIFQRERGEKNLMAQTVTSSTESLELVTSELTFFSLAWRRVQAN